MLPDDLAVHLRAARPGGQAPPFDVRWLASTTSTMDVASRLAHEGAPHGVVVGAEQQTSGRGRRGTTWASPPGSGLYFSFIARPSPAAKAPPSLRVPEGAPSLITLAAGVAVREGIATAAGLAADLKWPNDLLIGRRKVAGILAEGIAIGSRDQAVIIGVGVNVQPAAYPPDVAVRATSVEGELGTAVDRGLLLSHILIALWDRLAILDQRPGDILQAWRAASPNAIGTRVDWEGKHGTTAGIDDRGALLVRTDTGVERIIGGEMHWHLR
ncbi:MAG TPA: biotin--[acetyl-CoA-carboxylase] ligase [Vicinamibacterales bacterium]|nr:biotin--[acetyl-CoA-carboxylase] ligase [Vicinamibacterales bacterium]